MGKAPRPSWAGPTPHSYQVAAFLEPCAWAPSRPTRSVETWMMRITLASRVDEEIIEQPVHTVCHLKRKSI